MSCRRTALLLHTLLFIGGWCGAQDVAEPVLISIRDALKEGATGQLMRVRGTVTHVAENSFFLQDQTAAIQVSPYLPAEPVKPGDVVQVTGALLHLPTIRQLSPVRVVKTGTAPLPDAEPLSPQQLADGAARCQRVRVKGSVHDVVVESGYVWLHVQSLTVPVTVRWRPKLAAGEAPLRPDDLLDALVEVTGVAVPPGPSWAQVLPDSAADIDILKPGSADVFTRPFRTLKQMRETPASPYGDRFRTIATVTYVSDAGWFYIEDDTGTARCIKGFFLPPTTNRRVLQSNVPLKRGEQIELVGFVFHHRELEGKFIPRLVQCEWRVLGHAPPSPYLPATPEKIMADHYYDGRGVSITGRVRATSITKDKDSYFVHLITLEEDGIQFYAMVQKAAPGKVPVRMDDYVRMEGVVMLNQADDGKPDWFRVNLDEFRQVFVTPEPWRARHLVKWLLGGVALSLGALTWILALRRQVNRQTAELRLANEELARFKQVADTTTDLVAMASLDQVPMYFNASGRAMIGIGQDEDVSKIDFGSLYTPETMERFQKEGFPYAFQHGVWQAEVTMVSRSGREIPVSFVGLVLRDAGGQPICLSCIARDISARREMEVHLRDSLEHERELNELKSSFVNTISHEFRTPLGIILFAASMLRRFDSRYGPEERAGQLTTIEESVDRMNELVEQSLSLGRAEAAEPQAENVDVQVLCHRVADEVKSSTSMRSPIGLEFLSIPARVRSDPTLLRAILNNLVGNAVKYSPAGSPVTLRAEAADGQLILTVRDHGPGLRPEDMPNLFMTFYRGSNTAGIPGTGLGLAIVRRCTDALGGSVTARNAEGGGAEFIVTLPLVASPPP